MSEYADYLKHHGVKGMQWGRRRYQNEDGSLTAAGKSRYKSEGNTSIGSVSKNQSDTRGRKVDVITTTRTTKNPLTSVGNGRISVSSTSSINESYAVKSDGKRATLTPVTKRAFTDRSYFDSNGQLRSADVNYTGRGSVSMDEEQAYKVLNSDYADLGDEDLDKLYELTGDIRVLKYRNERHSAVTKAAQNYASSSIVKKAATTVADLAATAVDSINKGTSMVKSKLSKWLK